MKYINAKELGILGKGFPEAKGYRRFSDKDLEIMTKIYPTFENGDEAWPRVGENSAGLHIDFRTDTRIMNIKWSVRYGDQTINLTLINQSGLDVYIKKDGKYRFVNVGRPVPGKKLFEEVIFNKNFGKIPEGMNEYTINLGTYDEIKDVQIGIEDDAKIEPLEPNENGYIAVYGTSITEGGCASRPGMIYTHMMRRELKKEIINLGLSGSGLLQPEMTDMLNRLDPKIMIMDSLANMNGLPEDIFNANFRYFYKTFRESHPKTPILFIGHPVFGNEWAWLGDDGENHTNINLKKLIKEWADPDVYWIEGIGLFGSDYEGTVDSVHATDLAFYRMNEIVLPVVKDILKKYNL